MIWFQPSVCQLSALSQILSNPPSNTFSFLIPVSLFVILSSSAPRCSARPSARPSVCLPVRPIPPSPRRLPSSRHSAHFHTTSWPSHYVLMNFSRGHLSGSIIRQHKIIYSYWSPLNSLEEKGQSSSSQAPPLSQRFQKTVPLMRETIGGDPQSDCPAFVAEKTRQIERSWNKYTYMYVPYIYIYIYKIHVSTLVTGEQKQRDERLLHPSYFSKPVSVKHSAHSATREQGSKLRGTKHDL